jgi:hypothetical protein
MNCTQYGSLKKLQSSFLYLPFISQYCINYFICFIYAKYIYLYDRVRKCILHLWFCILMLIYKLVFLHRFEVSRAVQFFWIPCTFPPKHLYLLTYQTAGCNNSEDHYISLYRKTFLKSVCSMSCTQMYYTTSDFWQIWRSQTSVSR